jgi:putative addiction module killer protein
LETVQYEILECLRDNDSNPIQEWLATLDPKTRARVRVRIDRIEDGNFGDVEPIGEGLSELKLDFGPGYRVYFGQRGNIVHLISGGFKSSQQRDITAAKKFWRTHE